MSYFIDKRHFEEDSTQNYLVFQPLKKYFELIANTDYASSWKSKGLSDETINPSSTSDNSLTPGISYYDTKMRVKFTGSCLKQPISYNHGTIANIFIAYELGASGYNNSDPTLKNCLIGAFALTKMQILISWGILVTELDLIEDQVFHFWVVDLVKMY